MTSTNVSALSRRKMRPGVTSEFAHVLEMWAFASKQEDRYRRLVCYRAGWGSFINGLFRNDSFFWPEILPAAHGDDPRMTTFRARISDLYGGTPVTGRAHYFVFLILDDSILSQPDELSKVDAKMVQELHELCEDASARAIRGVCVFGTRLRIHTMDTQARTVARGLGAAKMATEEVLWDLEVSSEAGLRTLCEYVYRVIDTRIEPCA